MKKYISLIVLFLLFPLSACLEKKSATMPNTGSIEIHDAYAFATMPGGATGAAFMTIKNKKDSDDTLISVQSDIAQITEIHQNIIDPDDGTMMMRKIPDLNIPANEGVTLEPKGYHVMFINLKKPLTMGQTVPIIMEFENNTLINVDVKILPPGTKPNSSHHHSH